MILPCIALLLTVLACQICESVATRAREDHAHLLQVDAARYANCTSSLKEYNCEDPHVIVHRTFDGTCNNLIRPLQGATRQPLRLLLPPAYEDGVSLPVGYKQATSGNPFSPPWPSPRYISSTLMQDLDTVGVPTTNIFTLWGQFLTHDMDNVLSIANTTCDCDFNSECFAILVDDNDPSYGVHTPNKGRCLDFIRSTPACKVKKENPRKPFPRTPISSVTAYIDASIIYGTSKDVADSLRQYQDGLLKEGGRQRSLKGHLPVQDGKPPRGDVPFFLTGDARANQHTALIALHTIWMREHNRIARGLAKINPCWGDQRLYDTARKIVGAKVQAITYGEYLPIVFGPHYKTYVNPYAGYDPKCDASIPLVFATSAMRFGHSTVTPTLERLDRDFKPLNIGPLSLADAFLNPIEYYKSGGTDPILRGLITFESKAVDEFVATVLTNQLFSTSREVLGQDLASLDIHRGRDHGQQPYRKWQSYCEDLYPGKMAQFRRKENVAILKKLYGTEGFKYGMDLWPAGLAEKPLQGAQVGPTFACILGRGFSDLRNCDRFWFENPSIFTEDQISELKHSSLSKVICENADDISQIQRDAFKGGERITCDHIPDVNLGVWRDSECETYDQFSDKNTGRDY